MITRGKCSPVSGHPPGGARQRTQGHATLKNPDETPEAPPSIPYLVSISSLFSSNDQINDHNGEETDDQTGRELVIEEQKGATTDATGHRFLPERQQKSHLSVLGQLYLAVLLSSIRPFTLVHRNKISLMSTATILYAKASQGGVSTSLWPQPPAFFPRSPGLRPRKHGRVPHPREGCVSSGALPRTPWWRH